MSSDDEPKALAVALVLALALYLIAWGLAGSPFERAAPEPPLAPAATGLLISAHQLFLSSAETPLGARLSLLC